MVIYLSWNCLPAYHDFMLYYTVLELRSKENLKKGKEQRQAVAR